MLDELLLGWSLRCDNYGCHDNRACHENHRETLLSFMSCVCDVSYVKYCVACFLVRPYQQILNLVLVVVDFQCCCTF